MKLQFHKSFWKRDHPVYALLTGNLPSGFLLSDDDPDLVLVPTWPDYAGALPWLLLIEDWATIYNPEIINGCTAGLDVLEHPKTEELRAKFRHPTFRGIACHHRGTFDDLARLRLTEKLYYVPIGLPHREANPIGTGEAVTFTFINSWKAAQTNFLNRGGALVMGSFINLWNAGERRIKLKIIATVPGNDNLHKFIRECPGIEYEERHIDRDALDSHLRSTDCLLLPSHRVHCHSILMPFSYGVPVITSDGWGTDEYVVDGWNGRRIPGVWGKTSWRDDIMRENYSAWRETLISMACLGDAMLRFVDDRALLQRLGRNAQRYAREVHTVERMRSGMLEALGLK